MRRRIYIDTSVIGGCLDTQYSEASLALVEMFKAGAAIPLISDLTELELARSPAEVRQMLEGIPEELIEHVQLTAESAELAGKYVEAGVVSQKYLVDAQHIAVATVSRSDVLVSWNFRHIVNLQRVYGYNSVNLRLGYPLLEIRSPREVIQYGD